MTDVQILAVILFVLFVVLMVTTAIVAAVHDSKASHEQRVARIQEKQQNAMRQIDETAEYYTGLYKHIAKRMDDEFRRRQSG
jgi:flagellar basal body-associated protein FliL